MEEERRKEARYKEIISIIMDPREELDEPHVYTITYSYSPGGGYGYGEYRGEGTSQDDRIMTEREKLLAEKINPLSLGHGNGAMSSRCTGIESISLATREMTNEEKASVEVIKRKIEIIKSSDEGERNKIAQLRLEDGVLEIDDEHAALCSLTLKKYMVNIMMSDEIEKEAQERENKAMIEYKEAHPIRYTFKSIMNAIKNRNKEQNRS